MTVDFDLLIELDFILRGGNKKEKRHGKKGFALFVKGHKHNDPKMINEGISKINKAYISLCSRLKINDYIS